MTDEQRHAAYLREAERLEGCLRKMVENAIAAGVVPPPGSRFAETIDARFGVYTLDDGVFTAREKTPEEVAEFVVYVLDDAPESPA